MYRSCVPCKKCHHMRCFAHLLKRGVHSSVAIVAVGHGGDHQHWHERHQSISHLFPRTKERIIHAELSGDFDSNLSGCRLAMAATSFPRCLPINSSRVKHGWYDTVSFSVSSPFLVHPSYPTSNALAAAAFSTFSGGHNPGLQRRMGIH